VCRAERNGPDEVFAYGVFEEPLRELVHLFKYGGVTALARPLGRLLRLAVPRDRGFDLIVPTPLHWRRRWTRGYNQAMLLARELAPALGLKPVNALRRTRATSTQAGLSRTARRANVAGAFVVRDPSRIHGRRVLLVDDVMTTGATLRACAAALKRAGARSVSIAVLARAGRPGATWPSEGADARISREFTTARSLENAKLGSTA
jgi:ComF family protein